MDAYQLHLTLNYYPMIGTVIGLILLVIGYLRRNDKLKRMSLWAFCVVALISMAVVASGEATGRDSMTLAGAAGDLVRNHQATARLTFVLMGANGITAAFGLLMLSRRSPKARWFVFGVLLIALATAVFVTKTTLEGRRIKSGSLPSTNGSPIRSEN